MENYSDDAFYENLTLGLIKVLGNTPGIQNVNLEKRSPCDRLQISTWEQRHSCALPHDMKQFYLSTDGFKLTWSYEYAGEVLPVGHMIINGISDLRRIGGVKAQGDSDCPSLFDIESCSPKTDPNRPHFCVRCKIFEIDSCQNDGRVCLVYLDKSEADADKREKPKIWLLDRSFEWHFLADTFTQYFRMMLVHQGLPQWQFRFTNMGLTQFAENILRNNSEIVRCRAHRPIVPPVQIIPTLVFPTSSDNQSFGRARPTMQEKRLKEIMMQIAPHLLQNTATCSITDWPSADNGPINQLDPTVFRNVRDKKKKEAKTENAA